jgi:hypothetical protein
VCVLSARRVGVNRYNFLLESLQDLDTRYGPNNVLHCEEEHQTSGLW